MDKLIKDNQYLQDQLLILTARVKKRDEIKHNAIEENINLKKQIEELNKQLEDFKLKTIGNRLNKQLEKEKLYFKDRLILQENKNRELVKNINYLKTRNKFLEDNYNLIKQSNIELEKKTVYLEGRNLELEFKKITERLLPKAIYEKPK